MKQDLKLLTGNKVTWTVNKFTIMGVVLEDHGEGEVEILTHTCDGKPFNSITFVSKDKLTLFY
jgi:hypothetical protein